MSFSIDHPESRLGWLIRMGWRWLLGFDFLHAFHNRHKLVTAEVVWTHTESQFLSVLLLFELLRIKRDKRPRLIAQSVWLVDEWDRKPAVHKWLCRTLIRKADVLTFHSPDNRARAHELFPGQKTELVLFGIPVERTVAPEFRASGPRLRLLAVGNDPQRDWATLIDAVAGMPDWHLRIVSQTCPSRLAEGVDNVEILPVSSNEELMSLYSSADLAIVPLVTNFHASGITALEEAVLMGIPVIASDTGGLHAYFSDDMVTYVEPGNHADMRAAIEVLTSQPEARLAKARLAQTQTTHEGLSSFSFARRHVEISRALLERGGLEAVSKVVE
ncbi:glycosyltransferase family 4 protein [Novosphingobium album (ex Hu et al. 2023)]|uniref:Glycosyltransferase family 4 protein n=1 Tax=Novosphingobium album (ex Hu et al. 2023) TaxID=2930093 RepID=A0ABT0B4G2_9SPHN|nr:glycosyltransferase family 4 protein [Novosphingobium album (ex Hu et al. 2023)]MCJ2179791.1 glycosyltransferase family 4 protein [Novosphingobium album (ex Hu et al. 2023)]